MNAATALRALTAGGQLAAERRPKAGMQLGAAGRRACGCQDLIATSRTLVSEEAGDGLELVVTAQLPEKADAAR